MGAALILYYNRLSLDRALPSLPVRSVAVKRGSCGAFGGQSACPPNAEGAMTSQSYLYDNDHADARQRLRQLESIEDAATVGRLRQLDVRPGWCCLEVGAGAGSIAEWLADVVGDAGRVVATDVNTRHLNDDRYEVWRHDIDKDPLPEDAFDLVHVRHTLMHVAQEGRQRALAKLYRSLKPGGVALIEETDFSTWQPHSGIPADLSHIYRRGVEQVLAVYERRGMDTALGRALPRLMERVGYADIRSHEHNRSVAGGSEEAQFHRRTFAQLATSLGDVLHQGHRPIDQFIGSFDDPRLVYTSRTTVSVSAVRPVKGSFVR